jgi:hypothetical protein
MRCQGATFFQWSQRLTFNPSRLSPLASPPRAIAPAAGLGAALLRPYTLSSHVQRATFNLQPLTPLAPRLAPSRHCSRCRSGRSAAAPLHVVVPRSTCNVQPFNPSRLSPLASPPRAIAPAAGLGAALLRPYTLSSHVQRATFNLQPLTPLAPRLAPSRHCSRCRSGRSAAAPLHVVVPRSACNVQPSTPHASRPSPLASRLSPLAPPRTTVYRGRWHGTAPQVPHTAAIPPASDCAAGGGRTRRSGPSGATTTPALCHPHSR